MAVAMAVISCLKNKALPRDVVVFGEVGLSGEVRSVSSPLARVKEAFSLGFKTIVLPKGNVVMLEKEELPQIRLIGVQTIKEASSIIFS